VLSVHESIIKMPSEIMKMDKIGFAIIFELQLKVRIYYAKYR